MFPNEIENFVKGVLFKYMSGHKDNGSRIADFAGDFLKNNPNFDFEKSSSAKMFAKIRQQLEKGEKEIEGFVKKSHTNHIKSCYGGDERYTITLPKTEGKMNRGNRNLSSDAANKCFLEVR